jgi:hypothetical protein
VLLSLAVLSAIEEAFQTMLLSMGMVGTLLLAGGLFYKVVQGAFVGAMSAEQIDKVLMEAEVLAKYTRS